MPKILVCVSYASLEAYEFDGIIKHEGGNECQYHKAFDINISNDGEIAVNNIADLFSKYKKGMSDAFGSGWFNDLAIVVLWSPEFTDQQKAVFKEHLLDEGVKNFDFYDSTALLNYSLIQADKFDSSFRYAIDVWANISNVYITLYSYTADEKFKFINRAVVQNVAVDPRIPYLTDMMLNQLRHVDIVKKEKSRIKEAASKFIKSGRAVDNVIVTFSDGYERTFTLTNEYHTSSHDGSDVLNGVLEKLLKDNHLSKEDCQVLLTKSFLQKKNLLDVVERMFLRIYDESGLQIDALVQMSFKQMEYTIKTLGELQQRISFCGDGIIIDKPELIVWTCSKCGFSFECQEAPKECPNCHGKEVPDNIGGLTINAQIHEKRTSRFFGRTEKILEIKVTPIDGGIDASLLLVVGKKPIGVYDASVGIDRWIHEFPKGIKEDVALVVTQNDYPALKQDGYIYIDIKPHYSYKDVNAFVINTKKVI